MLLSILIACLQNTEKGLVSLLCKKLGFIIFRQHLNSPLKVKGFRTYPVHTYTYLLDTV